MVNHTCLVGLLLACGTALGQAPKPSLEPIERRIDDTDPLRISLRQVERGLGHQGEGSRIYRTSNGQFVYMSGGIWAQYDQSRYVKGRKGKIHLGIPANTVFYIGPPRGQPTPPKPVTPEPALTTQNRVTGQVDGGVGHAVDAVWRPTPVQLRAGQYHVPRTRGAVGAWEIYRQQRVELVQNVFEAIDKAVDPKPAVQPEIVPEKAPSKPVPAKSEPPKPKPRLQPTPAAKKNPS
jgi:hypothetical protein